MKTKAQLSTDTLRQLGYIDAMQSATAEDAAFVEGRYDVKLEELRDKGLVYWANTARTAAEIPDAVYLTLVKVLALEVASAFGSAGPVDAVTAEDAVLVELRRHMARQASGEPTKALYF